MKKRILAIEDTADGALWLKGVLAKAYELTVVSNLVQARRELLHTAPDLILLDASLPDGDGFHFCRWIKGDELLKSVPVFLLTGRSEAEEREFGLKQGADEYLVKPIKPADLREKIQNVLKA